MFSSALLALLYVSRERPGEERHFLAAGATLFFCIAIFAEPTPTGQAVANQQDIEIARQYQAMALAAFAQDFEVWGNKRPCFKGLFVQGDGAFIKQRIWYKQFYNPRAQRGEFLKQCEGIHLARGMEGAPTTKAA